MIIKLNDIIDIPGGAVPFDYTTDYSDLEINFVFPFKNPVRIHGKAANEAGVIHFRADCETVIEFDCMRCAEPVRREWLLSVDAVAAEKLENPEDFVNADIVAIRKAELDADTIIREQIILESDMVLVCDDCEE